MPSHGHRKCLVLKAANPCPRPRVIPTRGRLLTGQEKSSTDQQGREIRQGAPAGPSAVPGADAVAYAGVPKDRARTELRIRLGLGAEIPRSVCAACLPRCRDSGGMQQLHRRTDWQILFLRPDAIRTTMTPISFRSELNNLSRRRSARRGTQCWASSRLNVDPWEELPRCRRYCGAETDGLLGCRAYQIGGPLARRLAHGRFRRCSESRPSSCRDRVKPCCARSPDGNPRSRKLRQ